ncbi:hypothetical protein BS47DRAFT_1490452 [Hydnum rufescens UP504]|uniref:Uncharacterized protein n=1 Tax=Hydnum rufescens UP504 TaxID=1448309 RepID=A0A9P6ACV7_9AGAM|nr:hypothetical protein BS47DRAFT_1490452 [Hydnum rufescens UP504]
MQDHIWRFVFLNTFDDPQKNNESHSLETPVQVMYQGCSCPSSRQRAIRGHGTILRRRCGIWSSSSPSKPVPQPSEVRSTPTSRDLELQEFSGSLNLSWLNQNARAHIKYFWPWLLPLKKSAGHKLERIPDMSWIASVFVTQIPARWCLMHLADIR